MNILDFTFYAGILGIAIGVAGSCIGLWALCTKRGKKYVENIKRQLKDKNSAVGDDKNIGAAGK